MSQALIAELPDELGCAHFTVKEPTPAATDTFRGTPGGVP